MAERAQVFLSYSRNDLAAAALLRAQLERAGLSVFKDDQSIREGDMWLERLQQALDASSAFVVLVGKDGVRRWIGAETQVALGRYFGPHDDAERLPIFPILLGDTRPETLPAFLRLFQATAWTGCDPLPDRLLEQIRTRTIAADERAVFEGCPFVGLAAYRVDQAHLFFGRQKETLDALACFDRRPGFPPVRWLEINGNSGSGKSSLMQAGLLPLVDQGWLWPRTGYERWTRIGPMMPGEHPVEMLAESLSRSFDARMSETVKALQDGDDALRYWLRDRKTESRAFLLAIDQFEELFTFADGDERRTVDRLLAAGLEDNDCPLFVLSTVRSDFLDRFAEDLPRLVAVRNRLARPWTLGPMGADGLREVIEGPARLAGLDVREVKEAMVAEARDEQGSLPLVENALRWLWAKRANGRLSGKLLTDHGGLAGILSGSADLLFSDLSRDEQARALELLFQLVRLDPEGSRHARRRLPFVEAVAIAGGGATGRALAGRLAGDRALDPGKPDGAVRLITITDEGRSVSLIHETLIRSKGLDASGTQQTYWPRLWSYIEQHKDRAAWLERIKADTRTWLEKQRSPSYQWSHERVREAAEALKQVGADVVLTDDEREFVGPTDPDEMLAELERPETTHKRRLLIGERLDVLGDPREGVGVDAERTPQIDWCEVPGGEVTILILSDPSDADSEIKDRLCRNVEPLRIARFPVTVTQFISFLTSSDGLDDPFCWGDDVYREEDLSDKSHDFGRYDNNPAVYVSWFDAVAFCRWLSRRLDFVVRLPDEWEWQQAATGSEENVFPWGKLGTSIVKSGLRIPMRAR